MSIASWHIGRIVGQWSAGPATEERHSLIATHRRQKQEEDKILEELEALNNRKDNLLVNIKGKYDDEVRSEVPLKLGVDRANNYDSKKKYAAPLKIQQDFREHQKKGNESKGEEKKLSRREEVELARAKAKQEEQLR